MHNPKRAVSWAASRS